MLDPDLAQLLDAERVRGAVEHVHLAVTHLRAARIALANLPSGRCAEDLGREEDPADLEVLAVQARSIADRLADIVGVG